jgi:hypothetical protein
MYADKSAGVEFSLFLLTRRLRRRVRRKRYFGDIPNPGREALHPLWEGLYLRLLAIRSFAALNPRMVEWIKSVLAIK